MVLVIVIPHLEAMEALRPLMLVPEIKVPEGKEEAKHLAEWGFLQAPTVVLEQVEMEDKGRVWAVMIAAARQEVVVGTEAVVTEEA